MNSPERGEGEQLGPYGCRCQTLHHRIAGDGCDICNPMTPDPTRAPTPQDAKAWLVEQMIAGGGWVPVQVELYRDRITSPDWRDVKRGGNLPPVPPSPGSFRLTPLERMNR